MPLSERDFPKEFCVNFLQYNGVISSLRQMLKLYPYGDKSSNLQTPSVPSSLQNIFQSSKGSKGSQF